MKIKGIVFSALAVCNAQRPVTDEAEKAGQSKRYSDMKEIATHIFNGGGAAFDDKQYWTYGCHCMLLGDRPLSEMGMGKPVDALDRACMVWKDCQKCVRQSHGPECIGEFVKYEWSKKGSKDVKTNEDAGTCERELFECDRQFAKNMLDVHTVYTDTYHMFYGNWDNQDPYNCVKSEIKGSKRECCGGGNKPYLLYNNEKLDCCADGIPRVSC